MWWWHLCEVVMMLGCVYLAYRGCEEDVRSIRTVENSTTDDQQDKKNGTSPGTVPSEEVHPPSYNEVTYPIRSA